MARMGHSTMRAALIYQHATRDRDQEIAKGHAGHGRAEGCVMHSAQVGGRCR
jgi:hypothetical protein